MKVKKILMQVPLLKQLRKKYFYWRKTDYRKLPLKELVQRDLANYEKTVGYKMDISNPRTFTEKLQWYKLFYDGGDTDLLQIIDKYNFKSYIKDQLGEGYTIPLYGVWETLAALKKDWNSLPEEFVLKSTLSSFGNNIMFIHNKSEISFSDIKEKLADWLRPKNLLVNSFCRAYHKGTPRIIAEQYMENLKNQLFDYKFFCFDGEPFCCCVNTQHFESGKEHTFPITYFDMNWDRIAVRSGTHETEDAEKPVHFDQMIEVSKQLSSRFPHVRVDFFDTPEQLYLAEMTFFSGGGMFKYDPESFNEKMGELFHLPIDETNWRTKYLEEIYD